MAHSSAPEREPVHTRAERSLGAVRTALEPLAVAHGVSLVDVIWTTERAGRTLRVTIERPVAIAARAPHTPIEGPSSDGAADGALAGFGVTVDDCAEFSRDASATLDLLPELDGSYCLEVSSPGLDRPLRTLADFQRFRGELAKVKLKVPAPDGQRVLRGTLEDVVEREIAMLVDGKRHVFSYANVESAQLSYEPKAKGKPGGKDRSVGSKPVGSKPVGSKPVGSKPAGAKPRAQRPRGGKGR